METQKSPIGIHVAILLSAFRSLLMEIDRLIDRFLRWILSQRSAQSILRLSAKLVLYAYVLLAATQMVIGAIESLRCSIITCTEAHEPLVFGELPDVELELPKPPAPLHGAAPDRQEMLEVACGSDRKCACIVDAIATMDSSWGTAGVGKRARNVCNMRRPGSWTPEGIVGETGGAVGKFIVFDSIQSGVNACAETYRRFYSDMSARNIVKYWASSSNPNYIAAVKNCF